MRLCETSEVAPLLDVWALRGPHGPSLPLGEQLCRLLQPEAFLTLYVLRGGGLHLRWGSLLLPSAPLQQTEQILWDPHRPQNARSR